MKNKHIPRDTRGPALFAIIVFLALSWAGCALKDAPPKVLKVPLHAQQQDLWCWAASGRMIMKYLGVEIKQCVQAHDYFESKQYLAYESPPPKHVTTCCPTNTNSAYCNHTGWPRYDAYGFKYKRKGKAISWERLTKEIDGGRPVGFAWLWTGGGGHYMIIVGYAVHKGVRRLRIHNPWGPDSTGPKIEAAAYWITYDEYRATPDHKNYRTDYAITKKK